MKNRDKEHQNRQKHNTKHNFSDLSFLKSKQKIELMPLLSGEKESCVCQKCVKKAFKIV